MSRNIDLLNKAREQKIRKDSAALNKDLPNAHAQVSTTHIPWLIWSVLLAVLLCNFGLTLKLYMTQRSHADENNNLIAKLNKVEGLLTAQSKQINNKIQSMDSKIAQLDKNSNSQIIKIENLDKAKNALFKKVSLLEAQLETISNINSATVTK